MLGKSKVYSVAIGALFAGGLALSTTAAAEPAAMVAYDVVDEVSIPKALTDTPGDAAKGRAVATNRKQGNCIACHAVSALSDQPYHGEVAPSLDGVADRYSEGELRMLVVDADKVFEGSIMPSFYRNAGYHRVIKKFQDKTVLSAQQVEDVVAFLGTLKE